MTQEEIVKSLKEIVAQDIGYTTWTISTPHLVSLVNKAIAIEREACAKLCDDYDVAEDVNTCDTAEGIAIAIRARGQA
jgi:hypothetical protein